MRQGGSIGALLLRWEALIEEGYSERFEHDLISFMD